MKYVEVKLMKQEGFYTDNLHLIGCLLLIIDPLLIFFPSVSGLHAIRSMAFPIFAYLLVEVFCSGQDFSKFAVKLLVFAAVFEIPFDLIQGWKPFDFMMNNPFFTLLCGFLVLGILGQKWNTVLKLGAIAAIAALSCVLRFEYGIAGILIILLFYTTRSQKLKCVVQICGLLIISWLSMHLAMRDVITMTYPGVMSLPSGLCIDAQYLSVLSLVPISLCASQRTPPRKTYLVYGCLPLAFLGIYLCRRIILGF